MCLYLEVIKLIHLTILQLENIKQIGFVFLFMSDVCVYLNVSNLFQPAVLPLFKSDCIFIPVCTVHSPLRFTRH